LKPGSFTPFNTLQEYQRFASALALSQVSTPTTTISSDATQVSYKDKTFIIANWISGMRKMFNNATNLLLDLCAGHDIPLNFPDNIIDDMSNSTYDYSWLSNTSFVDPNILLKHLMANPQSSPCTLAADETLIWDTARQIEFLKKAGNLNLLIAALHHMVPGQPCRIAELCDFRIRNGLRGRNIFQDHGYDWFITRRVKSETIIHREVFVPVKLPPELCQLVRKYLLIIRPVEINFARRLWGNDTANLYHEYLYVIMGKRLLEDIFYVEFKDLTMTYFNVKLGVRGYRQVVITIARAYLGSEYELDVEEEEMDALIEQRCHGSTADRRCYGVQSRYLQSLSSDLMFRFGRMSEWWWRLTGFAPGKSPLLPLDIRRQHGMGDFYISDSAISSKPLAITNTASSTDTSIGPLAPQIHFNQEQLANLVARQVKDSVFQDLQELIQRCVAAGIAEVLARNNVISSIPNSTTSSSAITSKPSLPSQLEYSFNSNEMDITEPQIQDLMDIDSSHSIPSSKSDALHLLQALYPDHPNPQFRSPQQKEMVQLALDKTCNFVGILPTGGGKSLVFLISALADQMAADNSQNPKPSKTVVIIPNKALLLDALRKATDFGIRCIQWKTSTPITAADNVALLFVALETATHVKFRT
jgi:DEAD/DEAH box helicase